MAATPVSSAAAPVSAAAVVAPVSAAAVVASAMPATAASAVPPNDDSSSSSFSCFDPVRFSFPFMFRFDIFYMFVYRFLQTMNCQSIIVSWYRRLHYQKE